MSFLIEEGNIRTSKADAIVIPARENLKRIPGVTEDIFRQADSWDLSRECKKTLKKEGGVKLGSAAITSAFRLSSKYLIHAVCIEDGFVACRDASVYRLAYQSALSLAAKHDLKTAALPVFPVAETCISRIEAFSIAYQTIREFLTEHNDDIDITLYVVRSSASSLPTELKDEIDAFIDSNLKRAEPEYEIPSGIKFSKKGKPSSESTLHSGEIPEITRRLEQPTESFADQLMKLIDERGMTNAEVYKKANISKQQFSRIISNKNYTPQKKTIFAFAISLGLTKEETEEFLKKAGHALTDSAKLDVVITYFLENHQYDIFEINEALYYYDLPLLGSGM